MGPGHLSHHLPRTQLPAHRHREPYLAIVLEGRYEIRSLAGVYQVREGDVIIHPWFDRHANRFLDEAVVFNVPVPTEHHLGLGAMRVWRRPGLTSERARLAEPDFLAFTLSRLAKAPTEAPRVTSSAVARALASPGLSVRALATRLRCRREYLHQAFRREFGVGPQAYRTELRRRDALRHLASRGLTLGQIAHRVGYADHAQFCRDWKQVTGLSPSETRALVAADGRTSDQDVETPSA